MIGNMYLKLVKHKIKLITFDKTEALGIYIGVSVGVVSLVVLVVIVLVLVWRRRY